MDKKEAARQRLRLRRANGNGYKARENIAEFERTCMYAGVLLGIAFGLMFFVGLI
ncbi:MAG: hypothetical protein IKB96_04445 [Prevotella sp.]|nr:hypothetical protein [Prevotella sp.]